MIPGRYNYDTESTQKTQNFSSASRTPKQSMLKKLDLNWNRKLEKLLNNTDDQDDYFRVYSDASNTTISTICINSSESRFTDSYWSDTDATRRDDIVIELSERKFYNTKVNPFPRLNFPLTNSSEKDLTKLIGDDNQNKEVAHTDGVAGVGLIDVRINADPDFTGVANEADDQKMENYSTAEGVSNEVVDVRTSDVVGSDSKNDQTDEAIPDTVADDRDVDVDCLLKVKDFPSNSCCISGDEVNNQNDDSVAATDVIPVEIKDSHSKEAVICDLVCDVANDTAVPSAVASDNIDIQDNCTVNIGVDDEPINEVTDVPNSENLVVVDDVPPEVGDSTTIEENVILSSINEVENGCNNEPDVLPIDDVRNHGEEQQDNVNLADENIVKNDTMDEQSQNHYSIPEANEAQINLVEEVIAVPEVPEVATALESTDLVRRKSVSSRNEHDGDVKRTFSTDSKPRPVSSTSSKGSGSLEIRKKRYRKTVDSNHRRNVERQLSKSSGCTKVTSTTTVHVTTNDDTVFDALADMPQFVNSSVIDLASSYIENRLRQDKNQRTRYLDSAPPSSSSSFAPSWRNEKLSSIYEEYISPREAYKQLNNLLKDGTSENLKACMYDEYNGIRFDDDIASSEDEFIDDIEDLNLTNTNWTPPQSELRRQVAVILKKVHPLENNYSTIIDDMLCKYLKYIHSKQRLDKVNRIVDCVNKPVSQQDKTEMLIRREIDDKKLNGEFYHSPMEPSDFTELGERRREAIIKKYTRCHNDRNFCYSYFQRSIDDRPVSKLSWRIAKLKQELELIFA